MKMKRVNILLALIMIVSVLISACGEAPREDDKISVVCTNFAVYDWVNEIIGKGSSYAERYEVTLLAKGGDIHSYQPTAKDIAEIRTCDLFVYVGGESDIWAEEIVGSNSINHLKLFDILEADLICNTDGHNHDEHNHNSGDYDEHIWLSPRLAEKSVDAIYEKIAEFAVETDAGEHVDYTKNKDNYKWNLKELDRKYREAAEGSENKTIVFADRFPFGYLTRDYGIECAAAFPGCSADQDAGFEVIARLAGTVDEYGKKTILVLENSNQSVAKTVIENTKDKTAEAVVMNSCQSVGEKEIAQGAAYIEIMEENLEALKKALE